MNIYIILLKTSIPTPWTSVSEWQERKTKEERRNQIRTQTPAAPRHLHLHAQSYRHTFPTSLHGQTLGNDRKEQLRRGQIVNHSHGYAYTLLNPKLQYVHPLLTLSVCLLIHGQELACDR